VANFPDAPAASKLKKLGVAVPRITAKRAIPKICNLKISLQGLQFYV
jgi:hypothetical protein